MDAHVFRLIGPLICQHLAGGRIERIYAPFPDVTTISFFVAGVKQCLIMRPHRSRPLFFLMDCSPFANPAFPPASIMRLRKYAEGHSVGLARLSWVERQMAFPLPGPGTREAAWLFFDLRNGLSIRTTLPEGFGAEPAWPAPAAAKHLCTSDRNDPDAPWRQFTVLTPPLRLTLTILDDGEAAALMVDLEAGGGELFWYGKTDTPEHLSAWPLPTKAGQDENITPATAQVSLHLLTALSLPSLLAEVKTAAAKPVQKQDGAVAKRQKRLLTTLEAEKKRLETMLSLGDDARLLQAELWRQPPETRLEHLEVPLDPTGPGGPVRTIPLNPLVSLTENMQAMFRKAAKASRGIAMLEKRMALIHQTPPASRPVQEAPAGGRPGHTVQPRPASRIQEFFSSDGFTLWRGRDAQGNREALKRARPHDLWFHVEDGPSAHLILRRDHAAQEVPETTLREAAILTALKSWRKLDPKAPVMVALAKHVQPVKGAKAGTVHVHTTLQTILVDIDQTLEKTLRVTDSSSVPRRDAP